MAVYNNSPKTLTAGEALVAYRSVKYVSGELFYSDSDEAGIGVTMEPCASGERTTVAIFSAAGTVKLTAADSFVDGASLYNAADGKVTDADPGSGTIRFQALEAATADGDIVEVLPVVFN